MCQIITITSQVKSNNCTMQLTPTFKCINTPRLYYEQSVQPPLMMDFVEMHILCIHTNYNTGLVPIAIWGHLGHWSCISTIPTSLPLPYSGWHLKSTDSQVSQISFQIPQYVHTANENKSQFIKNASGAQYNKRIACKTCFAQWFSIWFVIQGNIKLWILRHKHGVFTQCLQIVLLRNLVRFHNKMQLFFQEAFIY